MGRVDTPVGPVESTLEGPSSTSACIYGSRQGFPSFYYGVPGTRPPWSTPPKEVPNTTA